MKQAALLIVATILFCLCAPFGILTALVLLFVKDSREQFTKFSDYPFGIAYSIDMLGNIVCGDLFNMTMIKHGSYRFGVRGETISSVLGKNAKADWHFIYKCLWKGAFIVRYKYSPNLTSLGNAILNILDFVEQNHCIKSIQITN